MAMRISLLLTLSLVLSFQSLAQKDSDPVLFKVEGVPVHVSEFTYIYSKTNGKSADFSRKSLEEYLDLYTKFKLKVYKAREMRLDTITSLKEELAGYRRQLADSYLIDKSVTEQLVKEAYDRVQQDVDISHIFLSIKENATPQDTLAAYEKIMAAKKRIESGTPFSTVAKEVSEDKSAEKNGGHIGFITALFPNGMYALESAAYKLPIGKVSNPVRTNSGYHLLSVHSRRPARGEIEAAHILIRKTSDKPELAKMRIDSIYQLIQAGEAFEGIARERSEDRQSAANGGYVGFFGINRYEKPFEDAAFSLQKDGDYSKPFETSVGWHIVKRVSKKPIQPYNIEKSRLEQRITKDMRFEQAKQGFVAKVKRDNNFKEYPVVLDNFAASLADTFLTFKWKAPVEKSNEVLFSLGKNYKATLGNFTDYLGKASRQRMKGSGNVTPADVARSLYQDFVNEECMKHEEAQLEAKYPEFKSLMREYEEGILLFEATKLEVWDKASQDSVGLNNYYDSIRGKYRWNERALASVYRINGQHKARLNDVYEYAKTHTADEVKAKFNSDTLLIVSVEEQTIEKFKSADLGGTEWKAGALSPLDEKDLGGDLPTPTKKMIKFYKIEQILPASDKSLKEARGYVVADYQDYLEKQWVEQLRKTYKVDTDKKVFESLIKQ